MTLKIDLQIQLEEFPPPLGGKYKCKIIGRANGIVNEFEFDHPIAALNQAMSLLRSWSKTFYNIRKSTKKTLDQNATNRRKLFRT